MSAARTSRRWLGLPVNLRAILSAVGATSEESQRTIKLALALDSTIDAELLAAVKEQFRPATETLRLSLELFYDQPAALDPSSDALIVVAKDAPATLALIISALRAGVPAVILTRDADALYAAIGEDFGALDPASVIGYRGFGGEGTAAGSGAGAAAGLGAGAEDGAVAAEGAGAAAAGIAAAAVALTPLFAHLGTWMVRALPSLALGLARNLAFVREEYTRERIGSTSLQNAAIAAAFFIPGADLPVLTLNQIKLFLQIAAAYDLTLKRSALPEIVALIAGGLGFRALARRLVGVVPVVGWAVKGAIGYTATYAVGKAAVAYCEHGADPGAFAAELETRLRRVKAKDV